jgi:hypothetical protein
MFQPTYSVISLPYYPTFPYLAILSACPSLILQSQLPSHLPFPETPGTQNKAIAITTHLEE